MKHEDGYGRGKEQKYLRIIGYFLALALIISIIGLIINLVGVFESYNNLIQIINDSNNKIANL